MKILYSFNKKGFEADYWTREIAAASDDRHTFIPFNHGDFLPPSLYPRAQLLDELYYQRHPGLMALYETLQQRLRETGADAVLVDNMLPYHPDFLRNVSAYKVMRTSDGPLTAYDRDFAYVHAYDHVLYHSPAYSRDLDMDAKLRYVGARRADFWPHAIFDAVFDRSRTAEDILRHERDVEIVFVGALFLEKMPLLAKVKKAFGRRSRMYGLSTWKRNLYYNARYGFPGWVRPLPFEQYVPLYQRAKIGFNVHNRGDYTVGSYRLFELPANGVMQISDGGEFLSAYYQVGEEIVGYRDADDLIDKIRYYLENDQERERIALNGYRAVTTRHRFRDRMRQAAELIEGGATGRSVDV